MVLQYWYESTIVLMLDILYSRGITTQEHNMKRKKSKFAQITIGKIANNLELRLDMHEDFYGERLSSWYHAKHVVLSEVADFTGYSVDVVCGVVAVISPLQRWTRNLENAVSLIYKHIDGIDISTTKTKWGCFAPNKRKAQRILKGEDPINVISGAKVSAFYHNLRYPQSSTSVTIDSRMIQAAWGKKIPQRYHGKATYHLRPKIDEAIRDLALKYHALPHEIQAAVWKTFDF